MEFLIRVVLIHGLFLVLLIVVGFDWDDARSVDGAQVEGVLVLT